MKIKRFQSPSCKQLVWYEEGQGKPLVLIHGWGMSAGIFQEFATLLAKQFRVLMPDLPGHGQSCPTVRPNLHNVSALLAQWLKSEIKDPFAMAGWSLGGMLALSIAHEGLLPVKELVMIGSTPKFTLDQDLTFGLPKGQVHTMARNLKRRFEVTLGDFFSLAFLNEQISSNRLKTLKTFAPDPRVLPDSETLLSLLETLLHQDQRALLPELSLPTLVLHGELDAISPIGAGQFMADILPFGTFVPIAGVGHAPFLSNPQYVADKVMEFC